MIERPNGSRLIHKKPMKNQIIKEKPDFPGVAATVMMPKCNSHPAQQLTQCAILFTKQISLLMGRPAPRTTTVGEFNMKQLFALAAIAAATIATPVLAQDEVRPAFTGPYVAGLIGYDKARATFANDGIGSDDGLLYGGVVGYDINVGGAVFGLEGEYTDSQVKSGASDVFVPGDFYGLRAGRDLYAGIRIGGEVAPNVMLYGKGGYTNAKVKAVYDDGDETILDSDKLDGYRLGAGVETTMSGFTTRVEYRYSSYGQYRDTGIKVERHQVALLVGYRF
jgi:outer membrane immunogenic protein